MHCGANLSELHGALAFHRKCLRKRLGHQEQMYMSVFVEKCSMGMCSSWVHCTYCVGCLSSGISYIYIYGTLHHFVCVSFDEQRSIHFCYEQFTPNFHVVAE